MAASLSFRIFSKKSPVSLSSGVRNSGIIQSNEQHIFRFMKLEVILAEILIKILEIILKFQPKEFKENVKYISGNVFIAV